VALAAYATPILQDALTGRDRDAGSTLLLAVPGQATTPDGRLPRPDDLAFWTQRASAPASDELSWLQLATAASEQGRLRADLDAYARALAAANHGLAIAPRSATGLTVRAAIEFATDDFSAAETDARAALVSNERDPIARAILGDSLLELGRVADAAAIYDDLSRTSGGPALDIRRARLAYVRGHPGDALALARQALQAATGRGAAGAATDDPVQLAFYRAALGEYARLTGDAELARSSFGAALELRPDDLAGLVGLARVEAASGETDQAILHLGNAAAIAPLPEIEALIGDLQAALGHAAAATEAYDAVRRTATLSGLAATVFDRELILFDLDHGEGSTDLLDRAQAAAASRPDAYGRDVVAWAFHRLGREIEAWAASQTARASGIVDARLLYHAGAIAIGRGDPGGQLLLAQALDLGPALDPAERTAALALLGVRP
jgi:tetratricopeptide (TPR) repeat protein